MELEDLLQSDNLIELKSLFSFDDEPDELIVFKYNLWARKYFPKYFSSDDAPFHADIDLNNIKVYRGKIPSYTDIAFRGAAKTARTKLFIAFCIANDTKHSRKYI